MKYQSEADIEKECTSIVVDEFGGLHRKLDVGPGGKGWLDHAYWLPRRVHFIIEYKIPGGKPSELQRRKLEWLRRNGHEAHLIDGVGPFRALLLRHGFGNL